MSDLFQMFRKLQSKTKKSLTKVGALFEIVEDIVGDIVEGIADVDFD